MEVREEFRHVVEVGGGFRGDGVGEAGVTSPADSVHEAAVLLAVLVDVAIEDFIDFVFEVAFDFDGRRRWLYAVWDSVWDVGFKE